jgi:hypothetical protein
MERVECWTCGLHPYIREGRIEEHSYTRIAYAGRRIASKTRVVCKDSGRSWPTHGGSFVVTKRGPDAVATEWAATCDCGETWLGPEYADVELEWSAHCKQAAAEKASA